MTAGRPKWEVTPDNIQKVEQFAAQGLTQEQIARSLGISYQTLNERKKEYSDFNEAIKNGQAKGIATITNALFTDAKNGNTTAQIFYLKNRAAMEWKDRKAVDHSGRIEHVDADDFSDEQLAAIAARGGNSASKPKAKTAKLTELH